MKIKNFLYTRKLLLLNIFLVLYILTNLIGGERGLISYFEKKEVYKKLQEDEKELSFMFKETQLKNKLLSENVDLDYLDTLYRDNLKYGKKDEILIKLK